MRAAAALGLAIAGCACGAPARAPRPLIAPPQAPVPPSAPSQVRDEPSHTVEVAGVTCPREGLGLPGQSPPDAALVAFVTARAWCRDDGAHLDRMELGADGVMITSSRSAGDSSIGGGRACWAMAGADFLVKRTADAWDAWPTRAIPSASNAGGDLLVVYGLTWNPCPAPPAPTTATPVSGA